MSNLAGDLSIAFTIISAPFSVASLGFAPAAKLLLASVAPGFLPFAGTMALIGMVAAIGARNTSRKWIRDIPEGNPVLRYSSARQAIFNVALMSFSAGCLLSIPFYNAFHGVPLLVPFGINLT